MYFFYLSSFIADIQTLLFLSSLFVLFDVVSLSLSFFFFSFHCCVFVKRIMNAEITICYYYYHHHHHHYTHICVSPVFFFFFFFCFFASVYIYYRRTFFFLSRRLFEMNKEKRYIEKNFRWFISIKSVLKRIAYELRKRESERSNIRCTCLFRSYSFSFSHE